MISLSKIRHEHRRGVTLLPPKLQLRMLGTFDARLDGVPLVRFRSAKVRALLAYLGVEAGQVHLRDSLATLLWGEYPQREAQQSLSQALTNLRSILAPLMFPGASSEPILSITSQAVHFNPDRLWVDIHAFDSFLAASNPHHKIGLMTFDETSPLEEAVGLYHGPFLAGFSLPDSREFEEWVMLNREQHHQGMMLALERLVHHYLAEGRTDLVRKYGRQQLALEPWSESGHQALMLSLALEGQRGAALQQYEACRRVLAEEFGIEPSTETQALAQQIRDGITRHAGIRNVLPLPNFVAREREIAQLNRALSLALAGQGRVVAVTGEAGTGKTALLRHFAQHAQREHLRLIVVGGRCSAFAGLGEPLLPFREILQSLTGETQGGWTGVHGDPEQVRRLLGSLPQTSKDLLAEAPGLVGRLVSAKSLVGYAGPLGEGDVLSLQPASGKKTIIEAPFDQETLFGQVTRVLQVIARRQPLLLLIDDLQWADLASLSLLFHLGRALARSRILVLGAYRPSEIATFSMPLAGKGRKMSLPDQQAEAKGHPLEAILQEFARMWGDIQVDLDQTDGRHFVDALLDSEPNALGEGFRNRLTRHTGGHALFTIELLRAFEEQGHLTPDEEGRWAADPGLHWGGLPPKVEAVIGKRIGRLSHEERRLLEAASVDGESFSAEVVASALGAEPSWALQWLSGPLSDESRLVQAVGVQSLPANGRSVSRYRFAHALFQEYLYSHLDAVDRSHLHRKVGIALEGFFQDDDVALAQISPKLVQHFEKANQPLAAARYCLMAGRWAVRLAAYDEAIAHLEHGLALLAGVLDARERLVLELGLYTAMATPAMMQRGLNAPAYTQALVRLSKLVLHRDLQDDPQRLTALTVLALSAGWSANPAQIERVGQQLLDLVPSKDLRQALISDQQTRLLGYWALGFSQWLQGKPSSALEHLSVAISLYDQESSRSLGGSLVGDPGVMARAMLGAVQWQLGYTDQARACLDQAVAQAEALDQPSSVVFAHYIAAMVTSVVGRDRAAALHHAEALQPLGQVSLVYRAWAEMLTGQAQVACGQTGVGAAKLGLEEHLARVVEAGSTWQAAGSGGSYAGLMLLQAEVCAGIGRVEMGLRAIDQALGWIERTGMRATEADVWRMRGELLLLVNDSSSSIAKAEACFNKALGIARKQQARTFELRAALSLARLWQGQGRFKEAHALLADIYDWFTEGFNTADMIETKALLDELA